MAGGQETNCDSETGVSANTTLQDEKFKFIQMFHWQPDRDIFEYFILKYRLLEPHRLKNFEFSPVF